MPNYWTTEDAIVLVYFGSRGVLLRLVVALINLKGGSPRNARGLADKLGSLVAEEQEAGHPAFYNKAAKTWDLQVTDNWLVRQIVSSAKAKAKNTFRDEQKAPLFYGELKALMDFGPRERTIVGDIQPLDPVLAKLAWTIEFPASPATQTETNQSSATSSANKRKLQHTNDEAEGGDTSCTGRRVKRRIIGPAH